MHSSYGDTQYSPGSAAQQCNFTSTTLKQMTEAKAKRFAEVLLEQNLEEQFQLELLGSDEGETELIAKALENHGCSVVTEGKRLIVARPPR